MQASLRHCGIPRLIKRFIAVTQLKAELCQRQATGLFLLLQIYLQQQKNIQLPAIIGRRLFRRPAFFRSLKAGAHNDFQKTGGSLAK